MAEQPTLSEFFTQFYKPIRIDAKKRDPKTLRSYEESLKLWNRLVGDIPIDQITDLVVAKFITDMSNLRGKKVGTTMKASSIEKHCTQLSTVLNMAGPRSSSNRHGKGLITDVPVFDPPKAARTPPRKNWTLPEVRAMYAAADKMAKPVVPCGDTPAWWRALIVGAYFLGLRIFALLNICFSMVKDGWLTVPSEISKGGKSSRHFVHPEAMDHFEKIKVEGSDHILLYPNWKKGKRLLYDYLRKLQEHAGIAVERQFGFHSFRKTHTTVLASLTLEGNQSIELASKSAAHASTDITTSFYIGEDVQEGLLQQAILRMPSPCVRVETVEVVEQKVEVRQMNKFVRRAVEYAREPEWID